MESGPQITPRHLGLGLCESTYTLGGGVTWRLDQQHNTVMLWLFVCVPPLITAGPGCFALDGPLRDVATLGKQPMFFTALSLLFLFGVSCWVVAPFPICRPPPSRLRCCCE